MSEGRDERDELIRELVAALEAIVTHQETIGGGLAVLSTTRRIAADALAKAKDILSAN